MSTHGVGRRAPATRGGFHGVALRPAPVVLALALGLGASGPLAGCTAIGFGVGAMVDMSSGKGPAIRLATVPNGRRVTLWLQDGREVHGRFLGTRDSLATDVAADPQPDRWTAEGRGLRPVLLVSTHSGTEQIPAASVRRVSVPVMRGKVIGMLGGAAVDALMLVLAYEAAIAVGGFD